jgi:hypothetical protein
MIAFLIGFFIFCILVLIMIIKEWIKGVKEDGVLKKN